MILRHVMSLVAIAALHAGASAQELLSLPQALEQAQKEIDAQRGELRELFRRAVKEENELPDLAVQATKMTTLLRDAEIARSRLLTLEATPGTSKMPARSLAMWLDLCNQANPTLPIVTLPAELAIDFTAIDKHAMNVPAQAKVSLPRLAQYLVAPAKSDVEKARAIFIWVTANVAYDVDLIAGPVVRPEFVLQTGRTICEGFAAMTETLGKYAGLQIISIRGYARGLDEAVPVPRTVPGPSGILYAPHGWNALRLNGKVYFLEPTYATHRILRGGSPVPHKLQPHEYFLLPPEMLIYMHLPADPRQQFLPKPLTKAEVERLPDLQPRFFHHGFKLLSHKQHTLHAHDELVMTLEAPSDKSVLAMLVSEESSAQEHRASVDRDGNIVTLRARAPEAGKYLLRLYSGPAGAKEEHLHFADFRVHFKAGGKHEAAKRYLGFDAAGATLYHPRTLEIAAGQPTLVALAVPGAPQVRLSAGDKSFILHKHGDLFVGEENLPPGQVVVMANSPNEPRRFSFLVGFEAKER